MLFAGISFVLWDFNKFLSIFTGICLISTFFVTRFCPRAIVLLFQLDLACLAAYGISKFNAKQRRCVLWAILGITLLQFVWVALQGFNIDPIFHSLLRAGKKEMVGFSASPDQIGTFFALTAPTMVSFHPLLGIISLFGMVASKSSFAFVAGVASSIFYFYFKNKLVFKIALLFIIVISTIFLVFTKEVRLVDCQVRGNVWRYAILSTIKGEVYIEKGQKKAIVITNPILGYGFGNFLRIFPHIPEKRTTLDPWFRNFNCYREKFTHAHNDYVEAFFELGYLGLISLSALFISFIRGFVKSIKSNELILYFSSIVAYLLNASGNFLSQIAPSGMLLAIFYGMYEGARRELREQTSQLG